MDLLWRIRRMSGAGSRVGVTVGLAIALLVVPHAGMAAPRSEPCPVTVNQVGVAQVGDCESSFFAWPAPVTRQASTGMASAPATDTLLQVKGRSYSYLAQGERLVAFRNLDDNKGLAGTSKWVWPVTPSSVSLPSSPVPVLMPGGREEVIFLTGGDGLLYKLRASDRKLLGSRDTRRRTSGVLTCAADTVLASPAVQLYDLAFDPFRQSVDILRKHHDQLVFVITADGCGDTTKNRVIAYWASDLAVAWTFNATGALKVGRGVESCTVDYTRNRLYCGTDLPVGATGQASLFAINTLTGDLVWSENTGAVLHRPRLVADRLYVVNRPGTLQAYDRDGDGFGGAVPLWSSGLQVASPETTVSRNPATFQTDTNGLLILDSGGVLHAVRDEGNAGTLVWEQTAGLDVSFSSAPVALASLGKAWIGRNDGRVQQIDLDTGQPEGLMTVDPFGTVNDPTLDVDPRTGADRLVVAASRVAGPFAGSAGQVTRLILPLCAPEF